jgi:hypothetical protein
VAEPAPRGAPSTTMSWRSIDELAGLVGAYCWLEERLFELIGGWAVARGERDGTEATTAECRVWCAAASRRHGALATRWAERLPLRAGVDAAALVAPPLGLAPALDELAAAEVWAGFALLVRRVLPWLRAVYATHLDGASPVSEAPVMEVLVEARRAGLGEIRSGQALLQRNSGAEKPSRHRELASERAFAGSGILPAVRPS